MAESPHAKSQSNATPAMHPTKRLILDAALTDMEVTGEASIRINSILEKTGLTNGSLYYHFGSREQLIQEVISERFLGTVTSGLQAFAQGLAQVASTESLFVFLRQELVRIGTPSVRQQRIRRFGAMGAALPRPEVIERIVKDQARYFDLAGETLAQLQQQGIMNAEIDAREFAAWFLGLSLSRLLSDLDPISKPDESWTEFTYAALVTILTPR
jgi:AcrR family transcriptional regulator